MGDISEDEGEDQIVFRRVGGHNLAHRGGQGTKSATSGRPLAEKAFPMPMFLATATLNEVSIVAAAVVASCGPAFAIAEASEEHSALVKAWVDDPTRGHKRRHRPSAGQFGLCGLQRCRQQFLLTLRTLTKPGGLGEMSFSSPSGVWLWMVRP